MAAEAVDHARASGRAVVHGRVCAGDLLGLQSYIQRPEQPPAEASLDLDRQDAEVAIRRENLAAAARDRQAIDKLKERRKAEHDAEWARKSQNTLDELALAVHRRGAAAA